MTDAKTLLLHIALLLMPLRASATATANALPTDSCGTALRAQLVVVSPGDRLYQQLGHCALRLQSEVHRLDYCFTFEADADGTPADYVRFFAGRYRARWVAVPTAQYAADYSHEQRTLTAYTLPLADDQIRQLWQRLDEAVTSGQTLPFNFIDSNCAQGVAQMLSPYMSLHEPQWMAAMDNAQLARHALSHAPWMQFLVVTLMGTEADGHWPLVRRTTPGLLPQMLTGGQAFGPAVMSQMSVGSEADAPIRHRPHTYLTPTFVFSLLLLLCTAATVLDWRGRCRRLTRSLDTLLFAAQAVAFLLLLWLTQVSGIFATAPNLYLQPLLPVPLLLVVMRRLSPRRDRTAVTATTRWAFRVYTLALLLFVAATPLSSQLDLSHQLVTASLAVRSLSYSLFIYSPNTFST